MFESTLFVVGFLSLVWVACAPKMSLTSVVAPVDWNNLGGHSPIGLSNVVRLWTGMVGQQSAWMRVVEMLRCPTAVLIGHHNAKRVQRAWEFSRSEMDSTALFPRRHGERGGFASDGGSGFSQRKCRSPG